MINEITVAAANNADKLGLGDAAVTAVFGYAVVFCGLVFLMVVISIVAAFFKKKDAKVAEAEENKAAETKKEPVAVQKPALAPGSAGHVKLYDVPDKEAAMIMAIVADKMQKPLNELRFISIKEVK